MDLVGNLLAPTLIQADVNFREGPAAAVGRTKEEIMSVRLIASCTQQTRQWQLIRHER